MVDQERVILDLLEHLRGLNDKFNRDTDPVQVPVELHCQLPAPADAVLENTYVVIGRFFIVLAGTGSKQDNPVRIGRPRNNLNNFIQRCLSRLPSC